MKTFLKFSGIIAFVVALVGFILMLATTGLKFTVSVGSYSSSTTASGADIIFGADNADGAITGIFAFILVLIALIIICAGVVLPLLKVTALDKVAGILNLVAVICLIVAGILCFTVKGSYLSANDMESLSDQFSLGVAFILGGILYIVAGVVAICPAIANLISKK